jgi:uncharacterized protein (TIGR02099 family)
MSIDHLTPAEAAHKVAGWWRFTRACYRFANRATHHLLGAVIKLAIVSYFIFGLLFIGLRYAVLPNIDVYKPDVERLATRAIGQPVTIDTIYASWSGLRPNLFLGGVAIHDRSGRTALKLPGVSATFSWWSVLVANVRLYHLEVSSPDLDILRDADGNLTVGGIFIDTHKKSDGRGADWLLAQREIVVREGRLRWLDTKRNAPELALDHITLVLRNDWQHHQMALKATPPANFAEPIDVRADFTHPHFTQVMSDPSRWKGELYLDLRNTDLAIWKPYVDYPFAVQKGMGGVRAWLKFDRARVADLTADLTLSDVSTQLRADLEPLKLTQVAGRISLREELDGHFDVQPEQTDANGEVIPTFGAKGHAIALTNFSMQTDDGLTLPATTITETYVPAKAGKPERTEIKAKLLDLHTLAEFIERLPLPAAQHKVLIALEPRGQLKDFSAQWTGAYPEISSYSVNGEFNNLSLKAQQPQPARPKSGNLPAQAALPAVPGFDNLTGRIDASDRGGKFRLDATDLKLYFPGLFADPALPLEKLTMLAGWTFPDKDHLQLDVGRMEIAQEGLAASFSGRHLMSLAGDGAGGPGTIDLKATIAHFDVRQIGRYLPLVTPPATRDWLVGALLGGSLRDATIRLKGDLAGFPFASDKSNEKARGEFHVAGRIVDGQLLYVPNFFAKDGKSPLWPVLEKINGTITFDRTRMEIVAKTAMTHNVAMGAVKAVIPDLMSSDLQLNIEGSAAGSLHEMVRYTVDSPVGELIGHFTEESRALGNARLGLKLNLPMKHLIDTKVAGSLQFGGNEVTLFNDLPAMQAVTGKLDFNERGLTLNGVRGNFIGGPFTLAGGTQRDDTILIKAEGTATNAGLRRAYPAPAMQRLADRITGSTRFTTTVTVKKKRADLLVESSLLGVALDFPAPIKKTGAELLPLRFEMSMPPVEDGAPQRDEIRLSLGPAITARYQLQRGPERGAPRRVTRGGIGVNVPAPQPDSGIIATVNMNSLSLDAWNETVAAIIGNDKPGVPAPVGAVAAVESLSVAEFIDTEMLAVRATELYVVGKKLDNVVVGASHQKGVWQANIDSAQASGYLSWNAANGPDAGRAMARLSSLIIPKSAASEVTDLLESKVATSIPALDIVADNFELFGKKLGRLELVANNVQASATREWRIAKLSLINPDAELKATGKWSTRDGHSLSGLSYALAISNAGNLLARLGFPDALRGGKGSMEGDVSWSGMPFALDIPSLSGQFKLDLETGQFLKVESGAAKLFSVLSLQALPRRLTLDFRDVFSEGFAFDGIKADAAISRGMVKTDNFKMRSVSATVLLDGSVDINKESQNLHAVVIPEINAGAASVVYALAVNPVIGVGTFLAQLFLRDPLSKAFTYEYIINGPWQEPVVTKIERKGEPAAGAAPGAAVPPTTPPAVQPAPAAASNKPKAS